MKVEICDVTLREGEQTPGVIFRKEGKIEIAKMLDAVGLEVVEAGFPVVSKGEKEVVKEVASLGLNAKIGCLARAIKGDVDAALDCDVDVIGLLTATSDSHIKCKYRKSREEVLRDSLEVLEYAKAHGLGVRFAAEDATRTDREFLKKFFLEGERHGADIVSIADTVGILRPATARALVEDVRSVVHIPVCVHCHDDLGLALANTLAAMEGGATQLQATVNGLGERAGNAPLEELLVALRVHYGVEKYNLKPLLKLSKLVERYSGVRTAKNKAVSGRNAFVHESGIHVAALLEDPTTYELFPPKLVGARRKFVLGKHTGKKAVMHIAGGMGYPLNEEEAGMVLEKVKSICETKKEISKKELAEIIGNLRR
jgi:methanogen homocitrate synthase